MVLEIEADGPSASATQIGAVGEALAAIHLILGSNGELSLFTPMADDDGIDLLAYHKRSGRAALLQVKSRTKTLRRAPKTVHFQVRKATFAAHDNAYLLAVLWENPTLVVRRAWLVPMADLPLIARTSGDNFVIRPGIDGAGGRFTPYRCDDLGDVARRLVTQLAGA